MKDIDQKTLDEYSHNAVFALKDSRPGFSASTVFTGPQIFGMYVAVVLFSFFIFLNIIETLYIINILFTLFLLFNFAFKYLLIWQGANTDKDKRVQRKDIEAMLDEELPIYSILVPMYKEPQMLPYMVENLDKLDYPPEKLDIKIVLEADDAETIQMADDLNLGSNYQVIITPHSLPKTKPKACNFALNFCKGKYVTIYDAEDRPDPDQLKKALICFKVSGKQTAVVQARLNYFNPNENWITRMFTMEYSLWFDFFLPALDRMNFPIPLGGTSNHFDSEILNSIGGWDPFNVTEDADLGLRIYQLGKKVEVIDSTTFEEANTQFGNWIRQRSRWLKGYMQTYLVHMRAPLHLYRTVGFKGFLSFQFFIGGTFVNALIVLFLYAVFVIWAITKTTMFEPIFPDKLLYLNFINLIFGNVFFIYIHMLGVYKRRYLSLIPYALTAPFYWCMLSIACYKGLYQLFMKPFYWEKTTHGLSKEL